MDRPLNREILRLSIPSILANLTVPLVGFVDTAVAGHLQPAGAAAAVSAAGVASGTAAGVASGVASGTAAGAASGPGVAAFIGAVSVGAMLFNLLYWNFGFLRTGTGGLTAQAFGRGDIAECGRCLRRSLLLALASAALTLALQWPFLKLALLCVDASPEVEALASQYFLIRVWAAPATLSLMAFSGWFVGMQDTMSSMWKDFVVNGVNVAASIILSFGIGRWDGLGFAGIAWGTLAAQYAGLLFCILVVLFRYAPRVFPAASAASIFAAVPASAATAGSASPAASAATAGSASPAASAATAGTFRLGEYFRMNLNLVGRSIGFTAIYIGYTMLAAGLGDLMLACSSILMHIMMIFSYFTDGFAYAGEALTGRFIGARDSLLLRRSVKYTFVWSMSIAVLFILIYQFLGLPILRLLTDDPAVVGACRQFLPWLVLMPPLGCAAFTWDGVYLGATASRGIRDAMLLAAAAFFAVWFGISPLLPAGLPAGLDFASGPDFASGLDFASGPDLPGCSASGLPATDLAGSLDFASGPDLPGCSASGLPVAGAARLHLLLAAYFAHLLTRTVLLSLRYRREVLSRVA